MEEDNKVLGMKIYISSSWKNRERVRALATMLVAADHEVYDFTDRASRQLILGADTQEIPPEMFEEQFDPEKHRYSKYLEKPEWIRAVMGNKAALDWCDVCVLLLPAGNDAHADWAYAVGRGKITYILGHPKSGDRTPTHLWAFKMFEEPEQFVRWMAVLQASCAVKDVHKLP